MLRDVEVLKPFIAEDSPSLVKTAALLAIGDCAINYSQLADPLIKLTQEKNYIVRALAYRALCEKLPADDLAAFIRDGLKDKNVIVREAVLQGIILKQPSKLLPELDKLYETEKDERLLNLVREGQDVIKQGVWLNRLIYGVGGLVAIALMVGLGFLPSVLKKRRERQLVQALDPDEASRLRPCSRRVSDHHGNESRVLRQSSSSPSSSPRSFEQDGGSH